MTTSPFDTQLAAAALRFSPFNANLLVRFVETAQQTSGGIHLPETMRSNHTEAEVVAAGPGRRANPSDDFLPWRWTSWPRVGDVVTFKRESAIALNDEKDHAVIDAENCLAIVHGDKLLPMGEWVLVKPDPGAQVTPGGIRLADRVQRWRQRGTIEEYGPGRLVVKDTCAVERRTVHEILNLPEELALAGLTVWWNRDAAVIQMGRERVESWLIPASELIAIEVED